MAYRIYDGITKILLSSDDIKNNKIKEFICYDFDTPEEAFQFSIENRATMVYLSIKTSKEVFKLLSKIKFDGIDNYYYYKWNNYMFIYYSQFNMNSITYIEKLQNLK